jgi:hypothetical protein
MKPYDLARFTSINHTIPPMMNLISPKDMKITSAWSIYFLPTGSSEKRTMILSIQQTGWSAQWKLTPLLIGDLVLGRGNTL